jgi:hypothetical protein
VRAQFELNPYFDKRFLKYWGLEAINSSGVQKNWLTKKTERTKKNLTEKTEPR